MSESVKLTSRQRALLLEAMRRYTQFHPDEELTEAWTGLGYPSHYRPVLKAGLMTWVYGEPKGSRAHVGWLRLTEAGAAIVQAWLDEEVTSWRSEHTIKAYMRENVDSAREFITGEIIPTHLAEDACQHFDDYGPEPYLDIPEEYFDWAFEVTQEQEELTNERT